MPSTTKGAGRTGSTHGEMNRPLPGENPAGVALGNADPVRRRRGFWVLGPWVGTGLLVLLAALVGGAWVGLSSGAPTTGSPATTAPAATASDAAGASASKAAKTAKTGKAAGGALTADFSGDAGAWTPLTGTWKIKGGTYQQTDKSGYDFISQFGTTVPAAYTVTVKMRGLADSLNSGVMIGQPTPGSRQGATIVDLSGKDYVRWGSYDSTSGTYKFIGGTNLGSSQDPAKWHTIAVTVAKSGTTVKWDGKKIGSFAAVAAGSVGLVTSQSAVEFDDLAVTTT